MLVDSYTIPCADEDVPRTGRPQADEKCQSQGANAKQYLTERGVFTSKKRSREKCDCEYVQEVKGD
jgi:hypothetical protein